jgi:hypothetical protein
MNFNAAVVGGEKEFPVVSELSFLLHRSLIVADHTSVRA